MDALTVIHWLTRHRVLLIAFAVLCAWPCLGHLHHMITHHAWMMMDIDAVLCGARTLQNGNSPYAIHPHMCAGDRPAAYVYAPQVATLFFPFLKAFGITVTRNLFIWLLLVPATLFVLWFALIKRLPDIDIRYRLLAFSALTSMTFVCANVGLVMHALILLSLLAFPKNRWPFTAAVLLCACVKPTFLAYFVFFLMDEAPLWRRGFAFLWRAIAGLAVVWLITQTAGPFGHAWQKTLHSVTMARQIGMGWFELTNFVFHVPGPSHLNVELAVGFMAVMTLCGMAISQWGNLSKDERLVLVMGLVPLMTPRLLDYDMVLIVPYAALLITLIHRHAAKPAAILLSWLFTLWLLYGIAAYMLNLKAWHRTPMDMLLFGIFTALAALVCLIKRLSPHWTTPPAISEPSS